MMHFFFISSSQRFLSNLVCVLSDDVFCNDDILNSSMYVQLTRSTAMQFVEIDTSYVHTMNIPHNWQEKLIVQSLMDVKIQKYSNIIF